MLLELAIGDAYGAGFEYAPPSDGRPNDLSGYVQHPRLAIAPGCYTDDTQMSLAVAEMVLSGQPWDAAALAERFVAAFRRDPRAGYSRRLHAALSAAESGAHLLAAVDARSDRSGAAMRACPIGVFPSVAEVLEQSAVQARITHDTPDGIAAAGAAALMTHYLLYRRGPQAALGPFLDAHIPGYAWAEPWRGEVGSKGWMSVRATVTALARNDRLSRLLQDCVGFGGDVDTVAAIALGVAACSPAVERDLPQHLFDALEDGPYGRAYIAALDRRLLALAERNRQEAV